MDPRIRGWERLYRHAAWANALVARELERHALPGERGERATRVLAHIPGTEWLWLRRLGRPVPEHPVWPGWSAAESADQVEALRELWRATLAELDQQGLRRTISYANSKGTPWTSRVEDVLDHVLLHGAHHRGQLLCLLREAGHEPPVVDLTHAARSGFLD